MGAIEGFGEATREWFSREIGAATPVQEEGWPRIRQALDESTSVLISAPTGTGKTLTAFLHFIDELSRQASAGSLRNELYLLYISPLKALGNDIQVNLKRPIEGVFRMQRELDGERSDDVTSPIRVAVRNGDTTPADRRKMLTSHPHILITTPESLYLLLLSDGGRRLLATVRAVIIDEIHALMETKRGAHMMVSLERLNDICGHDLPRIGLSATVKPLETAALFLGGYGDDGLPRGVSIVAPEVRKLTDLNTALAVPDLRALPEGSVWPFVCQRVYDEAKRVRTTLVFCEARATAEKLAHGVNNLAAHDMKPSDTGGQSGENGQSVADEPSGAKESPAAQESLTLKEFSDGAHEPTFARTHHGCVSKEQRLDAERELKSGKLRLLCATSSMELGIDVGEIDLVVQIGAPASLSRATQRLGRAGHRPGEVSRMLLLPLDAPGSLECAFTCRGVEEHELEEIHPPRLCLDVLAQHLVAMGVTGDYTVTHALELMRRSYCLHTLSQERLESVLRMLAGDFEHAEDKPVRPRILYDRINGLVTGDNWSRMLAVRSGGTIPDMGWYKVVTQEGVQLGELDEEFVFEARRGDRFLLGAFSWQILNITRDKVIVAPSQRGGAQSPFWKGRMLGRPYDAGKLYGRYMAELEAAANAGRLERELSHYALDENALLNSARYIKAQLDKLGALPTDSTIVVEHFRDEAGEAQLVVHSIFGAQVNMPLGMLLQSAAQRLTGRDIRMHYNDGGVLLHMQDKQPLPKRILSELSPDTARADVTRLLPAAPLFTIAFRCNAMRALMMGARSQGRVPLWVQRLRGAEAFDRALEFADHPLLWETMRECVEDYIDMDALEEVLSGVRDGRIRVVERSVNAPSEMARALRGMLKADEIYDYSPTPSSALRLTLTSNPSSQSDDETLTRFAPAPQSDQLAAAQTAQRPPESPDQLHARLMQCGDALPGELDSPPEWFEELCAKGRAEYIEPGLWIPAEQKELYEKMFDGDEDALKRVLRRCVRYNGPITTSSLAQRYSLDESDMKPTLDGLAREGVIRAHELGWVHRDVYERAQRIAVRTRYAEIKTAPPEAYAALIAPRPYAGTPQERLNSAISDLAGLPLPVDVWESVILPARVNGYRPQLLDALLAAGDYTWRLLPGDGQPRLAFYNTSDVDWSCGPEDISFPNDLQPDEISVLNVLLRRGASFASALSGALGGRNALPALEAACARGLVTCDSFAPLRRNKKTTRSFKALMSERAQMQSAGRWELARPIKTLDMDTRIFRALDRWRILCRETAQREGLSWPDALNRLRVMEYTQTVRRGYFVRGMSGAQFVRESELAGIVNRLANPAEECACVNAAEPMQPYGQLLPHADGSAFICVPGTVIVLCAGRVALICERQCESIRIPEAPSDASPVDMDYAGALKALTQAFRIGGVYAGNRRLCVKNCPDALREQMREAGFVSEAGDWVIYM